MDNHFTVIIDDHKGTTHFNLHKFVKKIIIYIIIFIFSTLFLGAGAILYLNHTVNEIMLKKEEIILNKKKIEHSYNELLQINNDLIENFNYSKEAIELQEETLAQKRMEVDELSSSLNAIETLIGIAPDKNASIEDRINVAQLNTEHKATLLQFIPNGSPIVYNGITSKYGYRIHPLLQRKEFHKGTDMKAKMNTPVYATADGMVEWASTHKKSGYGKLIIMQHNYGFKSYFGHLNKIVVKSKQFVRKGELIGYTGNTGRSSGPHLHYEIRYFYQTINPYWFIKWTVENYDEIFNQTTKLPWNSIIRGTTDIKVPHPTKTVPLTYKQEKEKQKKEAK